MNEVVIHKTNVLKRELWRFSVFEQNFIRGIQKKKEPLSERQALLLEELYQRYQRQLAWDRK